MPGAVAALVCAVAMVLVGVLTLPQAYRGIDASACILIGGMIPLSTAMSKSGGAQMIADTLINAVGQAGPLALAAGLFLTAFALTQVITNTASALLMLPLAAVAGTEMGISPMPLIIATIVGAHCSLLTPPSTPVNLMVFGPGDYEFGDYWKFGLPIAIWWFMVALFVVPLYWRF